MGRPKDSSAGSDREVIEGEIQHVIYEFQGGSGSVMSLKDGTKVVGHLMEEDIKYRSTYWFRGKWGEYRGEKQFRYDSAGLALPATEGAVIKFLERNIPGIGRARASRIWREYGENTIEVIMQNPNLLAGFCVPIGPAREALEAIGTSLEEVTLRAEVENLMKGFPASSIRRVLKKFGMSAASMIRKNPFCLLSHNIPGAGFLRCDNIWKNLGKPLDGPERLSALIYHILDSEPNGSTWVPVEYLEKKSRILAEGRFILEDAIKHSVKSGLTILRDGWMATSASNSNEITIAKEALRLVMGDPVNRLEWPDISKANLSDHQRQQLSIALSENVGILIGSAGTGKTHCLAEIVKAIQSDFGGDQILVTTPTGKAAVRIREFLASHEVKVECCTTHSALRPTSSPEKGWEFSFGQERKLPYKFIVADEQSMTDSWLMARLLLAIRSGAKVLLCGDPEGQLQPVGRGKPLMDMIDSGMFQVGRLNEILRNKGRIAQVCHAIRSGKPWSPSKSIDLKSEFPENVLHVPARSAVDQHQILKTFLKKFNERSADYISDLQVICTLNDRGPISCASLSDVCREVYDELGYLGPPVNDVPFRCGDKVMITSNGMYLKDDLKAFGSEDKNAYVANGQIGVVSHVCKDYITILFSGNECESPLRVKVFRNRWNVVTKAYAITTWKSQGSQWRYVILMTDSTIFASRLESREFHYTAVSRASELFIVIGNKSIMENRSNRRAKPRITRQIDRLQEEFSTSAERRQELRSTLLRPEDKDTVAGTGNFLTPEPENDGNDGATGCLHGKTESKEASRNALQSRNDESALS